ncbi:AMIN-like domain-containing (lipo)protein [Streptomyces erythrochromogenes]|uniref:AMIN-like domain-containing (lipo)protein n=1 Tax=Streptomyces erythrochromogenes TaxID=285574 RepID=UPI0033D4C431
MINARLRQFVALAVGAVLAACLSFAAPASASTRAPAAAGTQVQTPLVVNARWGGHATYDRIVIDLQGYAPGTTVTPVAQLRYDGSGQPVPLAGKYFLEIRLNPAAAHDDAGESVYRGPKLQKIYLSKLKGLAMTGDYEGYVTFGAAFDTLPYYRAYSLHSPERFVVDIAH